MASEPLENVFFVGEWKKPCTTSDIDAPISHSWATRATPLHPTMVILVACLTSEREDLWVVQDFFLLRRHSPRRFPINITMRGGGRAHECCFNAWKIL